MTSAQTRAIRDLDEALGAVKQQRDQMADLLLAILKTHGGEYRIGEGHVLTAVREAIVIDNEDGVLVVRTATRAREAAIRGPVSRGIRRVFSRG